MRTFFFLIFTFVSPAIGFSQSRKSIERANEFFRLEEYDNAIRYYNQALKIRENDKFIITQIASCYRLLNRNQEAQLYYEQIVNENPDSNMYYYALVLKKNGEYQKAKKQFNSLSRSFPEMKDYILKEASCDSAMSWLEEESLFSVRNLEEINSEFSDITPVLYKNGIIYASNREETLIRKKTGYSEQPYYNLFFSLVSEENYHKGKPFSSLINTSGHETAPSFSRDFKKIYFTRVSDNHESRSVPDKFNRPKLFSSEEKDGHWCKPEKFIFNDSLCSFGHPSVEASEKMFFFVSDLPGGYGGTDIYVCFNMNGKWTDPLNLGPVINTSGNELYPFYHKDGTLYFASDGHPGMGGFDIFSAVQLNGDWVKVNNLKPPVNSSSDDFSIFFNKNKSRGYFSSNRPGGKGAEDIYIIEAEDK